MDCVIKHFRNHIYIYTLTLCVLIILAVILLKCFLPDSSSEIVGGLFILFAALVAAVFSIYSYQAEQRTLRLQKIYFEDAFLGQTKSIELMMSETNKNFLNTENLYLLTRNVLDKPHKVINVIKDDLVSIYDKASENIKLNFFTTDFKKETISNLLHDSEIENNVLSSWIKKFEEDSYRFSAFLQSQIILIKAKINRLSESNKKSFLKDTREILFVYVQNNYQLILRHYILFTLLSKIALEFSSENYSTIEKIRDFFKSEKVKKILKLLDKAFKDVIADFESTEIANITKENAIQLNERIKCVNEKISRGIYTKA